MRKQDLHIFSGMQKDLDIAKHKQDALYDARNLRFTAREGSNLVAITNERGTTELILDTQLQGTYMGHCVIDKYVIVFTHNEDDPNPDYIYKVTDLTSTSATVVQLYNGDLKFDVEHPLETLGVYENDNVQKVYWVDGVNQSRVLNVCRLEEDSTLGSGNDTQFDFVQDLTLNEVVTVEKDHGDGIFSPGTIQYAFSYYNLYLQQTNIFYTTPLQYISFADRGGSPEDRVSNIFRITISNVDTRFDYVRVYSIHRTSLDAVPTVKRVVDIEIKGRSTIKYIDSGTTGDVITPTELLYVGGDLYSVETITSKDNTLFLANYNSLRKTPIDIDTSFDENILEEVSFAYTKSVNKKINTSGYYYYSSTLDSPIHGFKNREHYRLGFQLQHKSGKWSPPYYINDYYVDSDTNPDLVIDENGVSYTTVGIKVRLDLSGYMPDITSNNYIKIRPVCVFPKINERLVLTQGLLCPTIFGVNNRTKNAPYAQSSWFFRLNPSKDISQYTAGDFYGDWVEFRHLHTLRPENTFGAEIMGCGNTDRFITDSSGSVDDFVYAVDQSILTLHSPEIEWDDSIDFLQDGKYKLRLVGISNFVSTYYDTDIEATTPPNTANAFRQVRGGIINSDNAVKGLAACGCWEDNIIIGTANEDTYKGITHAAAVKTFVVYPWHSLGSLNNDINRPLEEGIRTSELKTKKLGNLRFSKNNTWFPKDILNTSQCSYVTNKYRVFNSSEKTILGLLQQDDSISNTAERVYYGNEDYMFSKIPAKADSKSKVVTTTLGAIEDLSYSNSTISNSRVIRMQYKSTKHIVLSLKNSSNSHRPIILPSINNLNRADPNVTYIPDWYTGYGSSGDTAAYIQSLEGLRILPNGQTFESYISEHADTFSSDPSRYNKTLWAIFHAGEEEGTIYLLLASEIVDQETDEVTYSWYCISDLSIYQNFVARYYSYGPPEDIHYYAKVSTGTTNVKVVADPDFVPTSTEGGSLDVTDYKVIQRNITLDNLAYPYLFIGELYRDPNPNIDFGGNISNTRDSHLWLPAGDVITLDDSGVVDLEYTEGDTWYTRYDCLKTYPFTEESVNNIIEVGSFMCESRINGDGRYDTRRGQLPDLLYFRPTNFNLMNNVYSQENNFFNYRALPDRFYKLDVYPNQVTWTLEKQAGQEIDPWTNLSLAATLDLDGTGGKITSLNTFNDQIFCFQDKAVNHILFNSRVQIPASDGVPIEISNSRKVEGKRLISDDIGCSNKWSIYTTPIGLYFLDSNMKRLYGLSEKLNSISDTLGMDYWFKTKTDFDSERTFYDLKHQDLYLVWNDECLVLNTELGRFTSFMDYPDIPAMFNIKDNFYSLKNDISVKMYSMFTGDYNYFFGHYKPYWLEFISNADSTYDKIFSNVDTRVDFLPIDSTGPGEFFDTIRVQTEYQDTDTVDLQKFIRKKFRVWRVVIPRDKDRTLDRIRNTWAKIRFTKNNDDTIANTKKMELHDMDVTYFV